MSTAVRFEGERICDVDRYARYLRDFDGYLMLPFHHMRKLGFVTQTVAALLEFVDRKTWKTFASVPTIAKHGRLPVRTVRRHLEFLEKKNLVRNIGREKPSNKSCARRTCTFIVSAGLSVNVVEKRDGGKGKWTYAELPCWAADRISAWGDRFVYATILSRRLSVERWESSGGRAEERLAMSATQVAKLTGLDKRSVKRAFKRLQELGLILREGFMERGDRCVLTLPKSWAMAILPDDWIPPSG